MVLLDHFDEIQSASDAELLRIYRQTLLRNTNGRLDNLLQRIIMEIKKRNRAGTTLEYPIVHIQTQHLPSEE